MLFSLLVLEMVPKTSFVVVTGIGTVSLLWRHILAFSCHSLDGAVFLLMLQTKANKYSILNIY